MIQYIAAFQVPDPGICILMEYAPGGDLAMAIREAQLRRSASSSPTAASASSPSSCSSSGHGGKPADILPSAQVRKWLAQVASGLQHVHTMGVLHRDLAPKNILLSAQKQCKISDFGLSYQLDTPQDLARTWLGTPYYMSPELLQNQPYGRSSDVWSLGVMAYELMALRRPFVARSMEDLTTQVLSPHAVAEGQTQLSETGHPPSLTALVAPDALLNGSPEARMDLCTLLERLEAGRGDDATPTIEAPAATSRPAHWFSAVEPLEAAETRAGEVRTTDGETRPDSQACSPSPPLPVNRMHRHSKTLL